MQEEELANIREDIRGLARFVENRRSMIEGRRHGSVNFQRNQRSALGPSDPDSSRKKRSFGANANFRSTNYSKPKQRVVFCQDIESEGDCNHNETAGDSPQTFKGKSAAKKLEQKVRFED